jgi:predicted phage baseplate assembly protein
VTNPVAPSGGTNAEAGDEARRNAPLRVRTLDRIVSLRDFEDFAAAFTGIGKAQAVWLWDGEQRMVHLTVAGTDGAPLDPNGALYRNLLAAIDGARPPHQPLRVGPCHDLRFGLTAGLWIEPDYEAEKVLATARLALATAFGFAARAFGQQVTGSEVLAALQGLSGVIGVDLDHLVQFEAGLTVRSSNRPDGSLPAFTAHWDDSNGLQAADLLLIDPTAVTLTERTS